MKLHPPERVTTDRLTLRKHAIETASIMFSAIDNERERLGKFLPWVVAMKAVGDEVNYLRWARAEWDKCNLYDYAAFRSEDDAYLGNIGFHSLDWDLKNAEIGFWISEKFENLGYVSEAVKRLTEIGFQIGFERIEIRCSKENTRSRKIPERLGFSFEKELPEGTLVFFKSRSPHALFKI